MQRAALLLDDTEIQTSHKLRITSQLSDIRSYVVKVRSVNNCAGQNNIPALSCDRMAVGGLNNL